MYTKNYECSDKNVVGLVFSGLIDVLSKHKVRIGSVACLLRNWLSRIVRISVILWTVVAVTGCR